MTKTLEEAQATVAHVPEHLQMLALYQLRAALRIEIQTGLHMSKGRNFLRAAQKAGITKARTKKAALKDVNEVIELLGGRPDKPLTD